MAQFIVKTKVKPPVSLSATSVVSTAVNVAWPVAPATGFPVVAYNVYRNGVLRAQSLTATSFIDTQVSALTTYSYEVSTINERGTESVRRSGPQVVTPQATAALVRWSPGWYLLPNPQPVSITPISEALADAAIRGISVRASWGAINTNLDQDNYAPIDDVLALIGSKRVIVTVLPQEINADNPVMPTDMRNNPTYDGGFVVDAGREYAKVWNAAVHTRLKTFALRLAARYANDSRVTLIKIWDETSYGSLQSIPGANFDEAAYWANRKDLDLAMIAALPNTNYSAFANFGDRLLLADYVAHCFANRVMVGGPDLNPEVTGLARSGGGVVPAHTPTSLERILRGEAWNGTAWIAGAGTDYRGQIGCYWEIQEPGQGGKEGSWYPTAYRDKANSYQMQYVAIKRKTTTYDPPGAGPLTDSFDIYWDQLGQDGSTPSWRTALAGAGMNLTTTACPPYYPGCNIV